MCVAMIIDLSQKELYEGRHDAGARKVVPNVYVLGKTRGGEERNKIYFTLKCHVSAGVLVQ